MKAALALATMGIPVVFVACGDAIPLPVAGDGSDEVAIVEADSHPGADAPSRDGRDADGRDGGQGQVGDATVPDATVRDDGGVRGPEVTDSSDGGAVDEPPKDADAEGRKDDAPTSDADSDGSADDASDGGQTGDAGDGGADRTEAGIGDASRGPGLLTLSLDPSLDTPPDKVLVVALSGAVLVSKTGAVVKTATLSNGKAVFHLAGVVADDYFIRVNGDANDLVPTRIDDPTLDTIQRVGHKLRASVIGAPGNPLYRVNTWSAGQAESPVARFSNGAIVAGEHAYVIVSLTAAKVEFRLLGSAALLTSFSPSWYHPWNAAPFDEWMLVSNAIDGGSPPNQHGVVFTAEVADGGMPSCVQCHTAYDVKPASYSSVTPTNSWCFHCHDGPVGGDSNGFVDPSK